MVPVRSGLACLTLLFLSACGDKRNSGDKLPLLPPDSSFGYTSPPAFTVTIPIAPIVPTHSVYLTNFSILPNLPAGLVLDSATGVISGTPTQTSAATRYTVSVPDGTVAVTATLVITVNPLPANFSNPRAGNYLPAGKGSSYLAGPNKVRVANGPAGTSTAGKTVRAYSRGAGGGEWYWYRTSMNTMQVYRVGSAGVAAAAYLDAHAFTMCSFSGNVLAQLAPSSPAVAPAFSIIDLSDPTGLIFASPGLTFDSSTGDAVWISLSPTQVANGSAATIFCRYVTIEGAAVK